jgi:hypothetical protein
MTCTAQRNPAQTEKKKGRIIANDVIVFDNKLLNPNNVACVCHLMSDSGRTHNKNDFIMRETSTTVIKSNKEPNHFIISSCTVRKIDPLESVYGENIAL